MKAVYDAFTCDRVGRHVVYSYTNLEVDGKTVKSVVIKVHADIDDEFLPHLGLDAFVNTHLADYIELDGVVVKDCRDG